jgi:hypothetical protein
LLVGPGVSSEFTAGVRAALAAVRNSPPPTDEEWGQYVDYLATVLGCLEWAGWFLPESYDSDFDREYGPHLFTGGVIRTNMVIAVEYDVWARELSLHPVEDCGEQPVLVSMLDDTVTIPLTGDAEHDSQVVEERAGALGLLDPTRLRAGTDSGVDTAQYLTELYVDWIFKEACSYRGLAPAQLMAEVGENETLSAFLRFVSEFVAREVAPDLVPDAVALGIACWCWRNNTDVEAHHLPGDVLMARVNIAVTKAVQPQSTETKNPRSET